MNCVRARWRRPRGFHGLTPMPKGQRFPYASHHIMIELMILPGKTVLPIEWHMEPWQAELPNWHRFPSARRRRVCTSTVLFQSNDEHPTNIALLSRMDRGSTCTTPSFPEPTRNANAPYQACNRPSLTDMRLVPPRNLALERECRPTVAFGIRCCRIDIWHSLMTSLNFGCHRLRYSSQCHLHYYRYFH